ncbi:Membrane protein of unknown function [Prochlorococcus marinus str. MIT 1342]|uniref:phage holin family protein n=1 Tax=Prochlorococcus TaxID=1218 RepID=UPI0007B3CDFD|nr:phage holin family protein [Prochlorococcus marinus]KZR79954.1 Membrane protein of unknown function [Prochlorococcus marinus str. MIT 1342]
MFGSLGWLLQWPIRALILLLVAALPLGIEMANFSTALWSALMIGLLGTLLIVPLKLLLGPFWAITSLGGLIWPVSFLFNWLITVLLFALAAWLINGFRLKNGLLSAIFGAVFYSVVSTIVLRSLCIADVEFTRAALLSA